ncbi:MAG: gephyrin-like molybdotransferase Glp [Actinomycetes bacterium]
MRPLDEVLAEVLSAVGPLDPIPVPIADAVGMVLAEAVLAPEDVPPFANTAMDGYAVRAADTSGADADGPRRLEVVGDLPAGHPPRDAVGPGQAVRIMTGAPIPDGADAIVPVERTERDCASAVLVLAPAAVGDHIRPAGGDVRRGATVFTPGEVLGPAAIGVLASLARTSVLVHPRPRVAVISTGDELVEGGGPLAPGQIRDSNRPMLLELVRAAGAVPIDLGVARDDEVALEARLLAAAAEHDAIVTSGGVSVGDYDVVKAVLDRIGVLRWSQIAIKPAKPFAFGVIGTTPVFGLPGNPVSSNISFELLARPALRRLAGHRAPVRVAVDAIAAGPFDRRSDGKVHYDRVVVTVDGSGRYRARRSGGQGSNVLTAMARANGLAVLEDGPGVAEGGALRVLLLTDPVADGA